jgi:hypothetical protein
MARDATALGCPHCGTTTGHIVYLQREVHERIVSFPDCGSIDELTLTVESKPRVFGICSDCGGNVRVPAK